MKHLVPFIFWTMAATLHIHAQQPAIFHLSDLQALTRQDNDTLYVLNFWATWCRPCVAEMPHFDRVQKEMEGQKVKVIFLSLDFRNQYDSHLVPFLKKRKPYSQVVLLDEPNLNDWGNEVSPTWSGAIPATLFVQHSRGISHFHEGDFTYESLTSTIHTLLSSKENEKD